MAADPFDPGVTEALRGWRVQSMAGLPLAETLAICATVSPGLSAACFVDAAERCQKGQDIGAIMNCLTPIVSEAERATIHAGFKSGRLDATLLSVIERRELWHSVRAKIRGRMMLPAVVLVMAAFIAPLPRLFTSGDIVTYLITVAVPLTAGFIVWQVLAQTARQRAMASAGNTPPGILDTLMLRAPLLAGPEQARNLAEFASLLGHMLDAGVNLPEALEACSRAMPNGWYRGEAARLAKHTRSGQSLASGLKPSALWPTTFASSLAISEKSGALSETCLRMGKMYLDEYRRAMEALGDWVPRFLYGLVALFVIWQIAMGVIFIGSMYKDVLNQ